MHIRRIAVESWRGLTCELADLSPNLNLICGPNESGKSRLVEALRFALFESSKGKAKHKAALENWHAPGEKPRVEVEFELGGAAWLLEKTFLGTGCNTVLRGAGKSLAGEEAEARLADLMGVSRSGASELKSSDWGIWSLLWVNQGDSREPPSHNDVSQARLQDQLSTEIGEAAAGELGQRILAAARERRSAYFTPSTGAPTGELKHARQAVAELDEAYRDAVERHRAVAADADELETLRRREAELGERIAAAEVELQSVRERHERVQRAERDLENCQHQAELARLELDRHEQARNDFRALSQQIAALDEEIQWLETEQARADAARAAAEAAHSEAARVSTEADTALDTLHAELRKLRRAQRAADLRKERAALESRLAEAEKLTARIDTSRSELGELAPITPQDVEALRDAGRAVEEARARLEGASASVELTARRALEVDGETLPAGDRRAVLVEDEKHIDVTGVLSLVVRPGGGDLARLRDALTDAEREHAALGDALTVRDVREADRIAQRRRDLEAELERNRETLRQHLPDGRDEVDARLKEIRRRLDELGAADDAGFDPEALEAAEARERALREEREQRRAQRDARAEAATRARDAARDLELKCHARREQLAGLRERLDAMPDEASLDAQRDAAQRDWGEKVAARDAAQQRFEDLGGEQLELELRQAEQAAQQLRERRSEVQKQCTHIEGRLASVSDDGRYERAQELEADLEQARATLARVEREARAAWRLHEVLNEAYQSARERLTAPVIERIRPYLADLFPGSEVWLDEEMNLLGMRGQRHDERFDALSGGAREQLSLLVRIGLAEVIGTDESWPLVLDDVLVNTDPERIRRVQKLLYRASRGMQVLLFTCHGPLFDPLGPDRRLELTPSAR
ncbi:MAG: AAA family ATPase [Pseudomonadota bacterium]